MNYLFLILSKIRGIWNRRNSDAFVKYLRNYGVEIGDNTIIRFPRTARIDMTRPALIKIGNNVDMNKNIQILTHDWSCLVFRAKYHDFINSSGKVNIGNNIYIGTNVIVLKGVTIGDNCIIGAGSVVAKDIPSNSVAVGIPCKVVCSLEEYYKKRKNKGFLEAVEYVKCFKERYGRNPYPHEMKEEFIYFVNKENAARYESMGVPIRFQLNEAYDDWMEAHKESMFSDFESFIKYVNEVK